MKTIKFIFSLLVSLVLVLPAMAAPTDGYVYAKDFAVIPGETAFLPIALKSTQNTVKAIEATITLPDGLSFVTEENPENIEDEEEDSEEYKLSVYYKVRKEYIIRNWSVVVSTHKNDPSNVAKLILFSLSSSSLKKGDYTILFLPVTVSSSINISNAKIQLSDESLEIGGNDVKPLAQGETLSSNITEATYSSGYSLYVNPFSYSAESNLVRINMDCQEENIADIVFDISVPSIFTRKTGRGNNPEFDNGNRITTNDHDLTMTDNHVSISPNTDEDDRKIAGKTGALLKIPYTVSDNSAEGIYQLSLSNIQMKNDDGTWLYVAPYTTEIYVGSATPIATPDANGVVAFHGNYSEASALTLMKASLQSDDIASADLSAVNAIGEIGSLGNNVIINAPEALSTSLASTPNVVINNVCASLVITDKKPFRNTTEFTATTASYTREMSSRSNWGTLCLPFAASSENANVYSLTNVTTGEGGEMTVKQAESAAVSANIPYIIKKAEGETAISFTASNVTVPVSPTDFSFDPGVNGWNLIGTNQELKVTTSTDNCIYFINEDKFWNAEKEITVAPFRAYFTAPAGSGANFRISEDTEGIEEIQTEADNATVYDLQGRTIQTPVAGQIYIRGAKKYIVK